MSDENGKLTQEERQAINRWILEKNIRQCPLCGHGKWIMSEVLSAIPAMGGNSLILGGQMFPMVGLVCERCGNAQFLNAIVIGLLPGKGGKTDV